MDIDNDMQTFVKQTEGLYNDNKNVCGQRHILAFMAFLSFVFQFAMRVNLSVAIVAMVKKRPEANFVNGTEILESCPTPQISVNNEIQNSDTGEFLWDEKAQGLILGAFYYSYGISNIIGGRISDNFCSRMLIGVGILVTSFLTLITPISAQLGVGPLVGVRVLEGCIQGVAFPAINKLLTKWYTTNERSKFIGLIFAGVDFGCFLTFALSGWLCESGFLGGWPLVFYIPGALGVIWVVFWFVLIRGDPRDHPRISEEELKYILEGRPTSQKRYPVPWASIFSSIPFWTTVVAHVGGNFGFYVMLSELPTYLSNIFHVPIYKNGFMSAAPYLASWIFSIIYSVGVDKAISTEKLSILSVRRLSVGIAGYGPMLCLISLCFLNCNTGGAFIILLVNGTLNGAAYCGFFASYSDLAPRYAGTLMGLGTAFGGIGGFIGPAVTGVITEGNQTISAWRMVFIVCVIIYGISTTIYEIFITTEPQPWNEPKNPEPKDKNQKERKFFSQMVADDTGVVNE